MSSSQKAALTGVVRGKIQWDAPLSAWTTFRIGGPADALVTLLDVRALQAVLGFCHREGLRWKILGRGSNILAADAGFQGIIIVLGKGFKYIARHKREDHGPELVDVGAGVGLARLSYWSAERGLSGCEFASGIPGSIGGAVAMNAGAWGRSMADVVDRIEVVDHAGVEIIGNEELGFDYRVCRGLELRERRGVVSAAVMKLTSMPVEHIKQTMRTLSWKRKQSQPPGSASGGSVFRNPEGVSAGQLIEAAGLKGRSVGGAEISTKHANFIINRDNATARDVQKLIDIAREAVFKTSAIELITELELLGDFD
jgi:UDP-N-acetylmuramate dehydrogenase